MLTSLTTDELRDILLQARTDIVADYQDEELLFYHDTGNANITTDRFYHFDTWEEMLEQPIFFGKRLEEIVQQLVVYW